MYFKPGDIVVWEKCSNVLYIILKVDLEKKEYISFILNHFAPEFIGIKTNLSYSDRDCKLLQDVKLK